MIAAGEALTLACHAHPAIVIACYCAAGANGAFRADAVRFTCSILAA